MPLHALARPYLAAFPLLAIMFVGSAVLQRLGPGPDIAVVAPNEHGWGSHVDLVHVEAVRAIIGQQARSQEFLRGI